MFLVIFMQTVIIYCVSGFKTNFQPTNSNAILFKERLTHITRASAWWYADIEEIGTTLHDRFTYEIDEFDKIIKRGLSRYLLSNGIDYNKKKPYENVVNFIIFRRSIGIHDTIRDMFYLLGKTDTGPESLHEDQADKLIRELSKRDMWPLKGVLSESEGGGGRLKTRKFKKSKSSGGKHSKRRGGKHYSRRSSRI